MPRLPAQGADGTSDARVLGTGAADVQVPRRWPTDDARPQPPARTDTHLASLSQLRGAWGTDRARLFAERLRGAFAMFDTDGDGRLSRDELIRVFLRPGVYAFRPEEVEGAVDKIIADFDCDGGLQFEEFVAWWTSGPPATSAAPEGSGVAEAVVESTPHSPPPIEAAAEMLEAHGPTPDDPLGRLLSRLLRHAATKLGVAISEDGWVRVQDALHQINGHALRAELSFVDALAGRHFSEADVQAAVAANEKRRFELDGGYIRAVQGHTMPGVAREIGTPLTMDNAPAVAVHGSYLSSLEPILRGGLSRMKRNHIHLAEGLLGEPGVISGMRRNAELFIWVNVQKAVRDGVRFLRASNGVILCDGKDGDGVLPPSFFSVVIEVRDELRLETAQLRLLERLFAGCSRVSAHKLHGGFSGSLVLRTESYAADGKPEEPTVTKIDRGRAMLREVEQTKIVADLGADAIRIMRGPLFADERGAEKQDSLKALVAADDKIDQPLRERLRDGTVRLLRCDWVASPESDAYLARDETTGAPILKRYQELPPEAFYSPEEAVELLDRGDRSVIVLS